ncbi:probable 3-deoxy-D-manno-octulosonic acid transferase, mitochondrial isoform X2 [Sorghum bicolor]|uniref:probable 3-deoxy-D-manno-octulosonic acid transferase, mitochondrial isoform X2 n=1 Tax=Sorghum bicolor TaxID=4558 RepID=UPI000B426B88|nr:probable 3-deoxy-D-manno-octulosonic acid transferase, mitochondrial isoform X2 [Sorghum bicolor]|eukprot:XP_021313115.1 probable 3-deoxy-D-manno-octulosonic acid transferase, mitochondrial isoform X2 [Sorghum bicolor]
MRPARAASPASRGGWALYELYRAASRAAAPGVLLWRRLQGLEHPTRWPERLGRPSAARPRPGSPLVWFHAVSLGEGMAALPVVRHCVRLHPDLPVLLTTTTLSSFEVIKDLLPDGVIYQFAPLDCPNAIDSFIGYWKPSLVLLLESELWPNLIMSAATKGSTIQAVRFQLLHTPPGIIHFAGDLKYAVGDVHAGENQVNEINDLQQQFSNRPLWMAASIHRGEEEVILRVHDELVKMYPALLLILVPRHPEDCKNIFLALKKEKVNFVLRSTREVVSSTTRVYMVDTLGELRMLYRVTPVAVIGGSFLPGLAGHNISEAAAAGCAVVTGPHVGHFYHMLVEMWQINPLAVKQVSGEFELLQTLKELLGDASTLGARQRAAKNAFSIMSDGVVNRVWNLVSRFAIDFQTDTWNS